MPRAELRQQLDVTAEVLATAPATPAAAAMAASDDSTGENDALVKDNKQLAMSGCSALVPFLVTFFILIPLWLCVMLPLTIVWKLLSLPCRLCCKPKPKAAKTFAEPPSAVARPAEQFDIILFGVTGFTGNLVARYVAKNYGSSVKWAIAGRRKNALESLCVPAIPPQLDFQGCF